MDNLQKLLDQKFPLPEGMSSEGHRLFTVWREIFTEGYKAGYADRSHEAALLIPTPGYNRKDVLEECKRLITAGNSVAALKLYKEASGCSLTQAKNILNL